MKFMYSIKKSVVELYYPFIINTAISCKMKKKIYIFNLQFFSKINQLPCKNFLRSPQNRTPPIRHRINFTSRPPVIPRYNKNKSHRPSPPFKNPILNFTPISPPPMKRKTKAAATTTTAKTKTVREEGKIYGGRVKTRVPS